MANAAAASSKTVARLLLTVSVLATACVLPWCSQQVPAMLRSRRFSVPTSLTQ
jgi:hypothetical protein